MARLDGQRALQWVVAGVFATFALLAGRGQAQLAYPTDALQRGALTVWIVTPSGTPSRAAAAQSYATYNEQTPGNFGQTASTAGQAASDMGQTNGSFGATAGSVGRPASDVGTDASDFGTASSNVGQTAGSYGQTSSTPLGRAPTAPRGRTSPAPANTDDERAAVWTIATEALRRAFPGLRLQIVRAGVDDLQARLAGGGAGPYPDVLLGDAAASQAMAAYLGDTSLHVLGSDNALPALVYKNRPYDLREVFVLRRAPHPEAGRAFLFWLKEASPGCGACGAAPELGEGTQMPAELAQRAVEVLLRGEALGDMADPAFAQVSPLLAQRLALAGASAAVLDHLALRTEVLSAAANERIASVGLRVSASAPEGFGVLHPAVVLRRDGDGEWRVLQISLDVPRAESSATAAFAAYARPVSAKTLKPVAGITEAAPLDGDSRSGSAELWWDNAGDASLLVVEWQTHVGGAWSDTHLMPVRDTGPILQVRVAASFAHPTNEYRWRVWSVGEGGVMNLSPWRRFTVLP